MHVIQIKRGTRAQIEAAKLAGTLLPGEPYLITDENRIGVGNSTNSYSAFVKEEELIDDKVAVSGTGNPGYLFGVAGEGLIRTDPSLSITKDINESYVEIAVENVDGGTF